MNLRIATRESPLALWQAHHVQTRLLAAHPGLNVTLVPMTTQGDRLLGAPLSVVGGKGLFVKELEQCMLDGHADIAVHSMKDVPAAQPPGLCLQAFLDGEDPRDAFVSNQHDSLAALPAGSRVGTSSLRRQAQLRALRPDLQIEELRGNVGTRLRKLDEGQYDAILLAAAGLIRLGLSTRIRERLDVQRMLPAIGQGIVGIECRSDDATTHALLAPLHDPASAVRLTAERAMNSRLGGACQVPVAGHATLSGDRLRLEGMVASVDGRQVIRDHIEGRTQDAGALGATLAGRLLDAGGAVILRALGIAV